jgi:hypothetical protein
LIGLCLIGTSIDLFVIYVRPALAEGTKTDADKTDGEINKSAEMDTMNG